MVAHPTLGREVLLNSCASIGNSGFVEYITGKGSSPSFLTNAVQVGSLTEIR